MPDAFDKLVNEITGVWNVFNEQERRENLTAVKKAVKNLETAFRDRDEKGYTAAAEALRILASRACHI